MKKMRVCMFVGVLVAGLMLGGCADEQKLSFESVESARIQANENSEFNAKSFRQAHPEYSAYSISMRGDSTQSSKCGQGDGWATIDLVQLKGDQKVVQPLKCSTVSAAIGCMTDVDFKTRPYASEDGQCNSEVPFPLPKIQK